MEHLAAEETQVSLRRWRRPKTELKNKRLLDSHSSSLTVSEVKNDLHSLFTLLQLIMIEDNRLQFNWEPTVTAQSQTPAPPMAFTWVIDS